MEDQLLACCDELRISISLTNAPHHCRIVAGVIKFERLHIEVTLKRLVFSIFVLQFEQHWSGLDPKELCVLSTPVFVFLPRLLLTEAISISPVQPQAFMSHV